MSAPDEEYRPPPAQGEDVACEADDELDVPAAGYAEITRSLSASFIAAIPLLAVYELGTLLTRRDASLAAQLLKSPFGELKGWCLATLKVDPFLILGVLLFFGALVAAIRLRRKGGLRKLTFIGMFIESCVYALVLGPFAMLVLTFSPYVGEHSLDLSRLFGKLVASCGAGLYEELIFRAGMLGALFLAAKRWGRLRPFSAGALALFVSATIFSAAHFLSPQEARAFDVFLYRFVAGVFLGVIYLTRGFGIAAWTHALYDVYVLCFMAPPESG